MDSGEIINNSYKGLDERLSTEIDIEKNKIGSKKIIIIISVSISIVVVSLAIFLVYYFVIRKDKLICEPGYYLPEDDESQCLKCSLDKCKICSGTKAKNTCTECFGGYILSDSVCEIAHSIKAIYNTTENDQTISLMHFMYASHITEMYIDDKNITEPVTEYTFEKSGSHKVFFLFDNELDSLADIFYGIDQLTKINFTHLFDTSKVTSLHFMFSSCRNLIKIEMNHFDTTNVETMTGMFQMCTSLTSIDVSNFDTSNVETMSVMFSHCDSLKSLDLSNFNTNNLRSISNMFQGCNNLTYINLKSFNTSIVYNMQYLFNGCTSLTSVDLSNFNISNVDFMDGMFDDCSSITSLNLSHFENKLGTKLDYMFFGCSSLKFLDISNFISDKNVTMFYGLPNQGKIYVGKNFSELIKGQIPNDWEFVIKEEFILSELYHLILFNNVFNR